MESYGNVFLDEEWMNLGSMFSSEHDHGLNLETSILWPNTNESNSSDSSVINIEHTLSYTCDHDLKSNFYNYVSQESSNATYSSQHYPYHDNSQFFGSNAPMDNGSNEDNFLLLSQVFSDETMEEILGLKQDEAAEKGKMGISVGHLVPIAELGKEMLLKRKYEMIELPKIMEDVNTVKIDKNPMKKTRVSRDNKNTNNLTAHKNQKMATHIIRHKDDNDEESHQNNKKFTKSNNGKGNVQSSSSSISEDDSNASQYFDGVAPNLTAKTKAGRGAATDPQSIYARKRRERINERLRILQTIIPNGTKVDISTMLEEAVHYVKFLQLQINLLSSDDKWMYAPIAYNGMDMGLYQNVLPNL